MTAPCSDHGYCDEATSICVCDHGYTSLGDFAVTEGMDCGQNVFVQEILNIFGLIFAASITLLMTRVLYLRLLHKRTLIDAANMTSLQYLLTGLSTPRQCQVMQR